MLQPQVLDVNQHVARMDTMLRQLMGSEVEVIMALADDLGRVKVDPASLGGWSQIWPSMRRCRTAAT